MCCFAGYDIAIDAMLRDMASQLVLVCDWNIDLRLEYWLTAGILTYGWNIGMRLEY
jgi:hypothetical protein